MKKNNLLWMVLLTLPLTLGFSYKGDGDFSEITRTYIPVIGITRGFTIELPVFKTNKDFKTLYHLGLLPEQTQTLHIDLITALPKNSPTPQQEKELLNQIPNKHFVKCSLINSKTKKEILRKDLNILDFPRMKNRKFRREFIINLLEIPSKSIPKETELEIQFEYLINEIPLDREMLLIVLMDAPYA